MRSSRSSLARRIAVQAAAVFTAISLLVLIAASNVLTSVVSTGISLQPRTASDATAQVAEAIYQLTADAISSVMYFSAAALLAITVVGTIISYRSARVSLRRVADISAHTRHITATTLGERLRLEGPADEIKDLADTIDDTLAQLDEAFQRQERFVANASHELRTPLATLRTSLESLATHPNLHEDGDVDRSLRNIRRMTTILDSLLVLAQARQLPIDRRFPVDLSTTVRAVWDEIEPEFADRGIDTTLGIDEGVYTVGDQTLLLHAVHNLLQNAVRYTPPGGTARFAVSDDGDHGALMTFANSGGVIPPADAPKLIEPFNRGPASRLNNTPGSGLGLSIVNSIVGQHGGGLLVTANPGGGLTVTLWLPKVEAEVWKHPQPRLYSSRHLRRIPTR